MLLNQRGPTAPGALGAIGSMWHEIATAVKAAPSLPWVSSPGSIGSAAGTNISQGAANMSSAIHEYLYPTPKPSPDTMTQLGSMWDVFAKPFGADSQTVKANVATALAPVREAEGNFVATADDQQARQERIHGLSPSQRRMFDALTALGVEFRQAMGQADQTERPDSRQQDYYLSAIAMGQSHDQAIAGAEPLGTMSYPEINTYEADRAAGHTPIRAYESVKRLRTEISQKDANRKNIYDAAIAKGYDQIRATALSEGKPDPGPSKDRIAEDTAKLTPLQRQYYNTAISQGYDHEGALTAVLPQKAPKDTFAPAAPPLTPLQQQYYKTAISQGYTHDRAMAVVTGKPDPGESPTRNSPAASTPTTATAAQTAPSTSAPAAPTATAPGSPQAPSAMAATPTAPADPIDKWLNSPAVQEAQKRMSGLYSAEEARTNPYSADSPAFKAMVQGRQQQASQGFAPAVHNMLGNLAGMGATSGGVAASRAAFAGGAAQALNNIAQSAADQQYQDRSAWDERHTQALQNLAQGGASIGLTQAQMGVGTGESALNRAFQGGESALNRAFQGGESASERAARRYEFDVSTETGRQQFVDTLANHKEEFAKTFAQADEQHKNQMALAFRQLTEQGRQFDATMANRHDEFAKTYAQQDQQHKDQMALAYSQLSQQAKQFADNLDFQNAHTLSAQDQQLLGVIQAGASLLGGLGGAAISAWSGGGKAKAG